MAKKFIPYGKQTIEPEDIEAVTQVLKSDWLTTGPYVERFEQAVCGLVGVEHAVAVSNGTAALHAAMYALDVGSGDEVIVPPITFAATANCILYQSGTPVFADVEANTLLIDPCCVEKKITSKTKAIIAVDYAGHPCDYEALQSIAKKHNLALVADACHALGGQYKNKPVGQWADLTVFSFHPVKHITTGEGGMVVTQNGELARRLRLFRNHGITTDHRQRSLNGTFAYEMVDLGYNYRITDLQCALGLSQLKRLPQWLERRRAIAKKYDYAFSKVKGISPLSVSNDVSHAYHLYVVQIDPAKKSRQVLFQELRDKGIGANVHYIPVHFHPYYRNRFGYRGGEMPVAEQAYNRILSLPLYQGMTDDDVDFVIEAVCV